MRIMSDKQFFGKILVPVDGSHSCLHAKMLAVSIAKKFKSKVTVVHCASHEFMHPELKAQYQLPRSILHKIDEAYLLGFASKFIYKSSVHTRPRAGSSSLFGCRRSVSRAIPFY